jgi:head-tail adaptor
MSPEIGDYIHRIIHLPRVLLPADSTGEERESWPARLGNQGRYWAARQVGTIGETLAAGLRQSNTALTLRVQGRPQIAAVDRVQVLATGDVYRVRGTYYEDGDTVITLDSI